MAVASLISMLATFQINGVIRGDLYQYGLQFSPESETAYWTLTSIVFAMGWLIIATSVGYELHLARRGLLVAEAQPRARQTTLEESLKPRIRSACPPTSVQKVGKPQTRTISQTPLSSEISKRPVQIQRPGKTENHADIASPPGQKETKQQLINPTTQASKMSQIRDIPLEKPQLHEREIRLRPAEAGRNELSKPQTNATKTDNTKLETTALAMKTDDSLIEYRTLIEKALTLERTEKTKTKNPETGTNQ